MIAVPDPKVSHETPSQVERVQFDLLSSGKEDHQEEWTVSYTVALGGKGGTGKTTIAGLLIRYMIRHGMKPVLAIDADSNANLNDVLGVRLIETLSNAREDMKKEVMRETGEVKLLVDASTAWIGNSKAIGALLMLLVGLLVTIGIGSSFSTVPIIAAIFVPLGVELGFSPLAIVSLVGTAGALGDGGSPASDSTLGPTAGLNADGQHNHIWDTVVPTFLHYNLPLLAFGWLAAMTL